MSAPSCFAQDVLEPFVPIVRRLHRTKCDEAGVAVASAWNGAEFVGYSRNVTSTPVERTETVIEAAYRAEVLPGLILQPDLQYVINPNMDPEVDNALQLGIRLEMSF